MTTPTFWRRATFSVAETAEMIGASEAQLRTWIARNPCNDFNGAKTNGRLWLSGCDGFYYLIVGALVGFGVPVRTAMFTAAQIATEAFEGRPLHRFLTVAIKDSVSRFSTTDAPDVDNNPALLLPLHDLHRDHMERCAEANARDAS